MLLLLIVKTIISQALWRDFTALSQLKQVGIPEPVQRQLKPSSLWRTWRSAIHRRQCHRTAAACKQRFPPTAACFLVLSQPESGFEITSTDDIVSNSSQDLFKLFPKYIQGCTSCPAPERYSLIEKHCQTLESGNLVTDHKECFPHHYQLCI